MTENKFEFANISSKANLFTKTILACLIRELPYVGWIHERTKITREIASLILSDNFSILTIISIFIFYCTLYRVRDWGGMFTIFVGFFISGIGTSFYYSFGVPYLDDNVSKENSPFLLGK